jgi:hypothetical protein
MNYEDLGNWGLDDPGGSNMYLHFSGSVREQMHQKRNMNMHFSPKAHILYRGRSRKTVRQYSDILRKAKYVKMAVLAGIE